MDAHPPPSVSALPSKAQEEGEKDPRDPPQCKDLISTLPLEEGWAPAHLRKYQGFWIWDELMPAVIAAQQHLKLRPTDILVATSVKCGTTWLKALTFATLTRNAYPLSQHPLLNKNPHEFFHFIEGNFSGGKASQPDALPPPRLLSSHLPYSLLPESVGDSGCRVIYVCRDPKDMLVSLWYFWLAVMHVTVESLPFSKAYELFCAGISPFGPYWDHHLGYWTENLRTPETVLFLKYEEMMEEPVANLKRLAEFMGCPYSEEEEKQGVVEEIVRLCSFDNLSGLEVNKTGSISGPVAGITVKSASYFRKGKVGDWVNHMSPEMAQKLDRVTQQKLYGSGLSFGGDPSQAPVE